MIVELNQKINFNINEYQKIWYDLPSSISKSLPPYDIDAKLKNEKYIEAFVDDVFQCFMCFPESEEEKVQWGKSIYRLITGFGENSEFINNSAISYLFSRDIKNITKEFFISARRFDEKMTLQDIGQAMRNVWIMNISQVLLSVDVQYTNSIFAYSMLYPYTDNMLDDKTLTPDYKGQINNKLKKIIIGQEAELQSVYETRLFQLLEMINKEYDRSRFTDLYQSILSIQEAQETSICQQNKALSPYEKDILNISLLKGGTSVLADGYLVKGDLTRQEIKFMLGYGIMLQLCDDLQDVQEDIKNNHLTIFSLTAKCWNLNSITNKLINFIDNVVDVQLKDFHYEIKKDMDEFLKQNCLMLAFLSMSKSRKYFSDGYLNDIERHMPFRFSFLKNIENSFQKKLKKIKKKYSKEAFIEMINYI